MASDGPDILRVLGDILLVAGPGIPTIAQRTTGGARVITISSRACPRRSVPRFWLVSDTRYSGRNIVAVVRLRRKEALKKGAVSAALFLHLRRTWAKCVSRVAQSATARLLGSAEATQNTCRTKIDRVAHDQLDIGLTVRQQTAATAHLPCVQYRLKPRCSAPGELCQGLFKV